MKVGKVYLVGAGPGDPKLLTIKALEILKKADVVIYDRLVTDEILKLIPKKTEKFYVGKSAGKHTIPQDKINELLVSEACKGKIVVRLKCGDPFIFGRGGEEAEKLQQSGIPFEVVPGISSALAAPAYAGIPLTHRKYSSSVVIVTGHEDVNKPESKVKWEKIATLIDTFVILMGVEKLGSITKRLIDGGKDPKTDVTIIEWGTTKRQRVIGGTLGDIAEKAKEKGVKPPAVIVIGDVVKLGEKLAWFGK